MEGLVTHLRNAKGTVLVDWLQQVNFNYIFHAILLALSTVPIMFSYWAKPEDALDVSRIVNNDLASTVRKNPKRFVGLANLPMHAPELAVEEMKRAVVDLKMSGFQIGSHVGDWNLDAKVR